VPYSINSARTSSLVCTFFSTLQCPLPFRPASYCSSPSDRAQPDWLFPALGSSSVGIGGPHIIGRILVWGHCIPGRTVTTSCRDVSACKPLLRREALRGRTTQSCRTTFEQRAVDLQTTI
jgi:hypothetical protein